MKKILYFLKNHFLAFLLIGITVFICFQNYTPGTWLSGWDTLHPEFNFSLNLKRVIAGVWREEQGLGAVAAHSHMADLPRILILWLASIILPVDFLRYFYIFLCLILGPLGVYWFIYKSSLDGGRVKVEISTETSDSSKVDWLKSTAAFLGGLFYLLNLGTLQHFYVPFEMFPVQFAALPWLFGLAGKFLKDSSGKKRLLLWFALVNLLAAPMAYAPHLWYAYFGGLLLFLGTLAFLDRAKNLKKVILLIAITLAVNSFWLLPNLYFLATHAQDVPLAKTNRLFSEEAFLNNKEFGTIKDTAILRNYLFQWSEHVSDGNFGYLLDEWIGHLRQPGVLLIGYSFFALVTGGLLLSVLKKNRAGLALLPVFLASFIFLVNMNPPFELLFKFFRDHFLLFKEGLRFPFTKFSILLAFTYSFYFALAINFLFTIFNRLSIKKNIGPLLFALRSLLFALGSSLLIYYMFPVFQGRLISPSMKIKIPSSYFQMFNWFNQQDQSGRITNLPLHSPYGWIYYDWNQTPSYQGAGFLWFGLKQPFLDRDFDRWTPANEQYYREFSQAVYSRNLPLVEKILAKYQIRWLILDESVMLPGKDAVQDVLFYPEIDALFLKSEKIKLSRVFGPKIKVYEFNLPYQADNFISQQKDVPQIAPDFLWSNFDQAIWDNSIYYSSKDAKDAKMFYPYRTFMGKIDTTPAGLINLDNEKLTFSANTSFSGRLIMPDYWEKEAFVDFEVWTDSQDGKRILKLQPILPQLSSENTVLTSKIISIPTSGDLYFGFDQEQIFFLESQIVDQAQLLGHFRLPTNEESDIYFWSARPNRKVPVNFDWLTLVPEACIKPEKSGSFGVSAQRQLKSIEISAQDIPSCINISLWAFLDPNTVSSDTLLQANFELQTTGEGQPQFSFYDADKNRSFITNDNLIRAGKADRLLLRFRLNPAGNEARVQFQNLSLNFFSLLAKEKLDFEPASFQPTVDQLVSSTIAFEQKLFSFPEGEADLFQPLHQPRNCGQYLPLSFDRKIFEENGNSILEYTSTRGSVCDFLEFPNLTHNQGYLLEIESRNLGGLPLRLCLANYQTHRCDVYDELGSQEKFKKEFFVIPPMGDQGSGFDLHFNNYSVGQVESVNQIKNVRVWPIPYNWLKSIKVANPHPKDQSNLLVFNQTFEKGWGAFAYQSPFSIKKLKNHVLVNNWANSWQLDEKLDARRYPLDAIYIIFLPQILEYLGFGLLIAAFAYILLKKLPKNTSEVGERPPAR